MKHSFSGPHSARRALLSAVILILMALLVYANTLEAPFVFDDVGNITQSPHIRMSRISPETLVRILKISHRPLSNFSFAVNYYIHGFNVTGYHVVNLAIHIITALLVLLVARQTLRLCGTENSPVPFFAAALWMLNPVHTQSVTYIVQRMNSLAALFYMLALFCYIRARMASTSGESRLQPRLFYFLCLFAAFFSLASKQIAATLPVILFLYEWYFFQDLNRGWLKKRLVRIGLLMIVMGVIGLIYLHGSPGEELVKRFANHTFTPGQRLLTEAGVVLYYVSLLLFPNPARLALIYDFPLSRTVTDSPVPVLSITALLIMSVAVIYSAKKHRLLSFAILWFLVTLVIESSVVGLAVIYEHRTYLPSVFPIIGLVWLIFSHVRSRASSVIILCIAITVGGIWTHQRNTVWKDAIRFWRDNAAKAPGETTVHNNLGQALLVAGRTDEAEAHFKRAIAIEPDCEHYNNMGLAMMKTGNTESAIAYFYQALGYNPRDARTHFNLGTACFQKQDLDCAREHLQQAALFDPYSALTLNNLASILIMQKKYEKAIDTLNRLAVLLPESTSVDYNLACVYALQGKKEKAVDALKKAVDKGYDRWHYMKTDPDLNNIHDMDYFKSLVQ